MSKVKVTITTIEIAIIDIMEAVILFLIIYCFVENNILVP